MEPLANLKTGSTSASVVMLQTSKNLTFLIFASYSTNLPSHTYTVFASTFPWSRFCGELEAKKSLRKEIVEGDRGEIALLQ